MSDSRTIAVEEQFDDLEQQRETANLGMWVFLGTELMFFGGLFLTFTIYRLVYARAFSEAAQHLDLITGSINTFILLTSSFLFSIAISAFEARRKVQAFFVLGFTVLLGITFLAVKGFEYLEDFRHGLIPGLWFAYNGPYRDNVQLFFVLYFIATGLHALHLIIGVALTMVLMALVVLSWFRPRRELGVGVFGLYWHFVDFIWIFIFSLFYLIGAK
jgi:cytochrome c oxidase subunit III